MNRVLFCQRCSVQYDPHNCIPLLLDCGHSMCMRCIIEEAYRPDKILVCSRCNNSQIIEMFNIKSMMINRDLLELVPTRTLPGRPLTPIRSTYSPIISRTNNFTPIMSSRSIYDSPQSTYRPYQGSPVPDMKCKLPGCNRTRYIASGVYVHKGS